MSLQWSTRLTERSLAIQPKFVEFIPEELLPGVLYISDQYKTALHLCCCGCGEEVVTPLNRAGWEIHRSGEKVSMWPSIGNWDYPCQSHYYIKKNQVAWAESMTKSAIRRVKQRDEQDRARFLKEVNAAKVTSAVLTQKEGRLQKYWAALRKWMGFKQR